MQYQAIEKRREIAVMLGLSPGHQDTWPEEAIERLIQFEANNGYWPLVREIGSMMKGRRFGRA